MFLQSFSSSDAILHIPPESSNKDEIPPLIFFLTGNPGLISYYDEFLSIIAQSYDEPGAHHDDRPEDSPNVPRKKGRDVIVAGFSLGGFALSPPPLSLTSVSTPGDTNKSSLEQDLSFPPSYQKKEIYSLQDQIELCYARLVYLVQRIHEHYSSSSATTARQKSTSRNDAPVRVILAGHSVGAYIALELIRLHHTSTSTQHPKASNPNIPSSTIISALLLTPTISSISSSPSGQLATPILTYLPFFPSLLQLLSSGLTSLISETRLSWLVSRITGMREGSSGLKATVGVLRERGCVRQALAMAGDEMREIGVMRWGGEVWGNEIWGVVREGDKMGEEVVVAPRLFFLFARKDHWVADVTRDEIVKGVMDRDGDGDGGAKRKRGATVVVDETDGLVHAWCLEQNEIVARRVRGWIGEILDEGL